MKKRNGIRIIKREEREEINRTAEKILIRQGSGGQKNQISVAERVKDWVRDFKEKKQNEAAIARRFFAENRLAASHLQFARHF